MRVRCLHRPRVEQVRKARAEIVGVERGPAHVCLRALVRHRLADGESLLWDDTFPHEVWNRSEEVRIALLLDRGAPFLELMPLAGYRMHDDKDGSSAGAAAVDAVEGADPSGPGAILAITADHGNADESRLTPIPAPRS